MSRTLLLTLAVLLALVGGVALWRGSAGNPPASFALLSDEEIAEFALAPSQKVRALTVRQASGPIINVSAPSGFSLNSPVDFDIQIEPRDGVAVDMGSLRIEYKLGQVWVNLTRRVMRQATVKGSRFVARGAELPPGFHALRLTVEDAKLRNTQVLVKFSVVN
jgi:hypothetical protein